MVAKQRLSKEEIDELSQALSAASGCADSHTRQVRTYDFMRPAKLSKMNLRALELVFSDLARAWSNTLSAALKTGVTVCAGPLEQTSFAAYAESLPASGLIFALSMDPLPGRAFVDIPTGLALSIVERMAGGKAGRKVEPRPLTRIGRSIVKQLLNRLVSDLAGAWSPVASVQTAVLESYTSVAEMETDSQEPVVVAGTVWQTAGVEDSVTVVIPVNSLDPVLGALDPQRWLNTDAAPRQASSGLIANLLQSIGIAASVRLGRARVNVRDLLDMRIGDVVRLGTKVNDPVVVDVGGGVKFHGRPGLMGNRLSVQITKRADQDLEGDGVPDAHKYETIAEEAVE